MTDRQILELTELCNALVDGTITDAAKAQLSELIGTSGEARQFYVRFMGLSASLHQYASEMQAEAPDITIDRPGFWLRSRFWWAFSSLAAAASVAFILCLWPGGTPPETEDAGEFVAQITGVKNCLLNPGDQLRRGQRLELTSGSVEITFDCGAQIALEGPAVLDLNSAWDATLERGTLKANVPAEAIGFRIQNPAVDVLDLGTEFSLVAGSDGTAELFVLKGKVEATQREKPAILLVEQQSRQFGPTGSAEVRDAPAKFKRLAKWTKLDRVQPPVKYVHCLPNGTNSTAAQILTPGLAANAARTIAFWMQLPAETPLADAAPMLSWLAKSAGKAGQRPMRIGWNTNPGQGPLGAVRTEFGRTAFIGTSSVRDGRWHHVAVVLVPHGRNPNKLHVKQYVDGHLECVTVRPAKKYRRNSPAALTDETLLSSLSTAGTGRFSGKLDELFIADRALVPREIKELLRSSTPAGQQLVSCD
ncbi:MAG: LamG-like jellyroll fold domain-containing protein [bacterium]